MADSYALQPADPKSIQDLTTYDANGAPVNGAVGVPATVQMLLQQMQDKFQNMSDKIIERIDDMGHRIDDLERNIADLMTQAGVEDHHH